MCSKTMYDLSPSAACSMGLNKPNLSKLGAATSRLPETLPGAAVFIGETPANGSSTVSCCSTIVYFAPAAPVTAASYALYVEEVQSRDWTAKRPAMTLPCSQASGGGSGATSADPSLAPQA